MGLRQVSTYKVGACASLCRLYLCHPDFHFRLSAMKARDFEPTYSSATLAQRHFHVIPDCVQLFDMVSWSLYTALLSTRNCSGVHNADGLERFNHCCCKGLAMNYVDPKLQGRISTQNFKAGICLVHVLKRHLDGLRVRTLVECRMERGAYRSECLVPLYQQRVSRGIEYTMSFLRSL